MTRRHTQPQEAAKVKGSCSQAHLDEVGWQHFMSVPVVEGKGSGEAGHGDASLHPSADYPPPGVLSTESTRSVAGLAPEML